MSFSLIHAADFASRVRSHIVPALRAGAVVLADRYVYTAFARDSVRGVSREWLRRLYSFAAEPTLAFYFDVPLPEAMKRIAEGRPSLKYYEAGLDLGLADDPWESFRRYQGAIKDEYELIATESPLVRIDATLPLVTQQEMIRALVEPHLEGVLRDEGTRVLDALRDHNLLGRYLDATPHRARQQQA